LNIDGGILSAVDVRRT